MSQAGNMGLILCVTPWQAGCLKDKPPCRLYLRLWDIQTRTPQCTTSEWTLPPSSPVRWTRRRLMNSSIFSLLDPMAHILSSVFKEHIENFIALKRQCGYGYIAEEKILYCFDKLANEKGIQQPIISKELAQELSRTRPNEAKATRYKRCITINRNT